MSSETLILAALDAIGPVIWYWRLRVLPAEGGADSCGWRRVAVADEISAWHWRGNVGWRQQRTGHELSKPIAGLAQVPNPALVLR